MTGFQFWDDDPSKAPKAPAVWDADGLLPKGNPELTPRPGADTVLTLVWELATADSMLFLDGVRCSFCQEPWRPPHEGVQTHKPTCLWLRSRRLLGLTEKEF